MVHQADDLYMASYILRSGMKYLYEVLCVALSTPQRACLCLILKLTSSLFSESVFFMF